MPLDRRDFAQSVAVIGAIGEQCLAGADGVQHVGCASAVMGLSLISLSVMGLPLASTRAWILVVSPPRERPMHRVARRPQGAVAPFCEPPF